VKTLLYITTRVPSQDQRGDQIRAFHQLKELSKKLRVTLICLSSTKENAKQISVLQNLGIDVHSVLLPKWKRYFALSRSLFSRVPFQVSYFYSRRIDKAIQALVQETPFDVIHCHLIRTVLYAHSLEAEIKSLDFMDAYGFGMDLRYLDSKNLLKRIILKSERDRLLEFETKTFASFDRYFAISKQDALRIVHPKNEEIIVSANGVDFHQFYPKKAQKSYDLVFMGNMDYVPNLAAVTFIVNEILPQLRKKIPTVSLLIAGRDATKLIQSYQSSSIDVVQHFDDISDSIASAKIMLAPMMISIGLQNKLLQAMAMKVPCITSDAANEAIGASPNKHILTATTAQEFIDHTVNLLRNETLQTAIAESAHDFVHLHFTWEHCSQQILSTIS
jgi:glycosyltransferase involved in cell wall biosynthesis